MNNFKAYLASNFGFSATEIEQLVACFSLKEIPRKHYFLKEGQYCKSVAFIEKGSFFY